MQLRQYVDVEEPKKNNKYIYFLCNFTCIAITTALFLNNMVK